MYCFFLKTEKLFRYSESPHPTQNFSQIYLELAHSLLRYDLLKFEQKYLKVVSFMSVTVYETIKLYPFFSSALSEDFLRIFLLDIEAPLSGIFFANNATYTCSTITTVSKAKNFNNCYGL